MAEVADLRIYGTTHERPRDRFTREQPTLIATTTQPGFRLAACVTAAALNAPPFAFHWR